MDTLVRIEECVLSAQLEKALELLGTMYGQTLPASDRGRAMAFEVVALQGLDRVQEAHNLVADIMGEEGDDYDFVLAAGIQFAELDSFAHAEIFLKNLCELQPDTPLPWFNLAITYGREKRYPESIHAYEKCLALNPDLAEAYFQKAYCHQIMGEMDDAAQTYIAYLSKHPEDGEAWVALGVLHSDRHAFEESYEAFSEALKTDHDSEDVHYNWAIAAVRHQNDEQLESCIDALQELNPISWRTLLTRADYEESKNHVWPAWEILREAFDETIADPTVDPETKDYVLATVLRFANRNRLHDHVSEVLSHIYDEGVFGGEVLRAMQILNGRASNAAASHQVVLKTSIENTENALAPVELRYIVYGVYAENGEGALEMARAFESNCSPYDWEVGSIYQLSDLDEGILGVYWRSELMDTAPGIVK